MNETLENIIEQKYSKLIEKFQKTIINNKKTIEILFYGINLLGLNYSLQKKKYIAATSFTLAIGSSLIAKYYINKIK